MTRADVAVVGLGAMGAATLYQLARRGVRATGIDRFAPPHDVGSSHGETRITRCAVGEGEELAPLVLRSHEIWRELEAETGEALLDACGFLMMAPRGVHTGHHNKTDYLRRTVAVAERHGIPHERLDSAALARRFPAFGLQGNEDGYFEPGGGFVRPERCIAAQLRRARELGAETITGCTVDAVRPTAGGARIETGQGTLDVDRVVVAAGAWAAGLLGPAFTPLLVPRRQVLHWFPVSDEAPFRPGTCPSYIWMHGTGTGDYFYGFPAEPGSHMVKVASEQVVGPSDPDTVNRDTRPEERLTMFRSHVAGRLRTAMPGPGRSSVCLYTDTPDRGFVIDRHPESERVVVVSACSGHGFKHSAAIGEAVADWIGSGRSKVDLAPFSIGRFRTAA